MTHRSHDCLVHTVDLDGGRRVVRLVVPDGCKWRMVANPEEWASSYDETKERKR